MHAQIDAINAIGCSSTAQFCIILMRPCAMNGKSVTEQKARLVTTIPICRLQEHICCVDTYPKHTMPQYGEVKKPAERKRLASHSSNNSVWQPSCCAKGQLLQFSFCTYKTISKQGLKTIFWKPWKSSQA